MNKQPSRLELLKNVPEDLRVEIIENEFREDFSESEKEALSIRLKPYLKEQTNQGKRTDLETTSTKSLVKVSPESVNQKIGKILKESDETIRKRSKVFEDINEDTKKALDSGETTLNSEYKKKIIIENNAKPIPPLPTGKFNHIVTDNGWDFGNKNIGGSGKSGASFHYKTQPTNEIARIPVADVAADNAILYEYTTNQHMITGSMLMSEYFEILAANKLDKIAEKTQNKSKIDLLRKEMNQRNEKLVELLGKQKVQSDAISVMHCHGFIPKCIVTWEKEEKEGWGGYWLNNTTEHLLIGIRGEVPAFGLSEKTIVKSKYVPNSHSKKPEEMWQLIEKCVAKTRWDHRKLEMNCRTPREGWYPHGDQITESDIENWKNLK